MKRIAEPGEFLQQTLNNALELLARGKLEASIETAWQSIRPTVTSR